MDHRSITRRGLLRAGAGASLLSVSGCLGLVQNGGAGITGGGGGSDGGGSGSTPQPAESTPTETSEPTLVAGQHGFVEDFEDRDLSDWEGDTDAFEITSTATRGSYAAQLAEGYSRVHRSIQPTTAPRYSFWFNVSRNSNLTVFFQNEDGDIGFSCEVQPGQGDGVVLNTDRETAGNPMNVPFSSGQWYRLEFLGVDFLDTEFDASLHDVGNVELIRTHRSFHDPIDAVSRIVIRNTVPGNAGPVRVDQIEIGQE